jgi:hypothetical protein
VGSVADANGRMYRSCRTDAWRRVLAIANGSRIDAAHLQHCSARAARALGAPNSTGQAPWEGSVDANEQSAYRSCRTRGGVLTIIDCSDGSGTRQSCLVAAVPGTAITRSVMVAASSWRSRLVRRDGDGTGQSCLRWLPSQTAPFEGRSSVYAAGADRYNMCRCRACGATSAASTTDSWRRGCLFTPRPGALYHACGGRPVTGSLGQARTRHDTGGQRWMAVWRT